MTPLTKHGRERTGIWRRIYDYFEANPDEELSRADMIVKFGASAQAIDLYLQQMREEGYLESVHVYRRRPAVNASRA